MKIGELASIGGCPVETVRYYEKEGLLPPPSRTDANYRDYTDRHLERLLFIRHCRVLDMSHEEIRQLLHWRDQPLERCDEVNALIDRHILHVSERIKSLQALEIQLLALRRRCDEGREVEKCGILHELTGSTRLSLTPEGNTNHLSATSVHESGKKRLR